MRLAKLLLGRMRNGLKSLCQSRDGNIALVFAIVCVPVIIAVGTGIDFARAYNVQIKMQSDLDAALIASVKSVSTLDATQLRTKITNWFAAEGNLTTTAYSIASVSVDTSNQAVSANVTASVPTIFMGLAGIKTVPINVKSTAKGPTSSYLQVYIVLDKSASMLLPSSQTDRTNFLNLLYSNSYSNAAATTHNYMKCEFACHNYDGQYFKYNGTIFNNIYDLVKSYNSSNSSSPITLRTDTALTAASQVIDLISSANATSSHITAGLYYFGADLYTSVGQTSSTTTLKKALTDDTYGLTSATSQSVSYFNTMLSTLTTLVGTAGDGSSSAKPLKLVLLLTDGAQSSRPWVLTSATTETYVAPLNPAWCSSLKTNGVTIGILNTDYLAITYDWGYNATLGMSMASANWYSVWGGVMRTGVSTSTTRRDYLQYALSDCASNSGLFISASSKTDIASGLSTIFNSYLYSVRLTQ